MINKIELWEDQILTDLINHEDIETSMPKIIDLEPLESSFKTISFDKIKNELGYEERKLEQIINDTDESKDEESSKTEEIQVEARPKLMGGCGMPASHDNFRLKNAKSGVSNYVSNADITASCKNRSRKITK